MIEVRNLSKIYRMSAEVKVVALQDVNLTIENGEFIAIMGSSGSGKSTLLHMIAGIDMPTSGYIKIDGTDINKLSPAEQAVLRRQKIGIIYQSYNLIPTLTVEENIMLPILLDKRVPSKEDVDELMELLQLKDRRKHLPSQLSGGQQQRTAIGRALLTKPAILLADEPTGNLDSRNTEEVIQLLCRANSLGQTIMLVTHDSMIGKRTKRQILINDGQIVSGNVLDERS